MIFSGGRNAIHCANMPRLLILLLAVIDKRVYVAFSTDIFKRLIRAVFYTGREAPFTMQNYTVQLRYELIMFAVNARAYACVCAPLNDSNKRESSFMGVSL